MAKFDIVVLTEPSEEQVPGHPTERPPTIAGQGGPTRIGSIDTASVAAELESLRQDLNAHITSDRRGLHLASLRVKLTLSAEGRVAFVAKGAAEACIEATFSSSSSGDVTESNDT